MVFATLHCQSAHQINEHRRFPKNFILTSNEKSPSHKLLQFIATRCIQIVKAFFCPPPPPFSAVPNFISFCKSGMRRRICYYNSLPGEVCVKVGASYSGADPFNCPGVDVDAACFASRRCFCLSCARFARK